MRYLVPKASGKASHIWTEMGPACGNRSIPIDRYELSPEPEGKVCKVCELKYLDRGDEIPNFVLDRPDVHCKCCGRDNPGCEDLQWGFYCGQCGEYWRYRVPEPPIRKLREHDPQLLPWE